MSFFPTLYKTNFSRRQQLGSTAQQPLTGMRPLLEENGKAALPLCEKLIHDKKKFSSVCWPCSFGTTKLLESEQIAKHDTRRGFCRQIPSAGYTSEGTTSEFTRSKGGRCQDRYEHRSQAPLSGSSIFRGSQIEGQRATSLLLSHCLVWFLVLPSLNWRTRFSISLSI